MDDNRVTRQQEDLWEKQSPLSQMSSVYFFLFSLEKTENNDFHLAEFKNSEISTCKRLWTITLLRSFSWRTIDHGETSPPEKKQS